MTSNNNNQLLQYAGYAMQLAAMLTISVFTGKYVDKKLLFTTPIFIWIFPLLIIIFSLYKVIKDTKK